MEKHKFVWKGLTAFLFFCLTVLFGLGTAHAETWDPNSSYRFINVNSGKAMDVSFESNAQGENIHQWSYYGLLSQQWKIQPTGDGYYKIVNAKSGKVADVEGPSRNDGANIHQWDYVGGDNQKWSIVDYGGVYKIVNKYSGKVIDVARNSTGNDANIHQWTSLAGINSQLWKIEQIPNSSGILIDPTRYYKIKSKVNPTKVWDVYASSKDIMKIQMSDDRNGYNQMWQIVPFGPEGTFTIRARHSGKMAGALLQTNSTTYLMQQYDPNGGWDQQWTIIMVSPGYYWFKNKSTNGYVQGFGDLYTQSAYGTDGADWFTLEAVQ
ncbi:RICIN domain-containing protein [Tumebacillus sp. DT12]|uniref:RICIN domain-containing protein n=1 Tax=Tumebacillus lacus TaxID=2995335 RepID=A0ABT3X642_9BACL|nr:RICIN domain-containing protein [Tumebacillus lacus]MCX7572373.1 RICIN domain-containing protein [Tumebacillus lacus]